jgi:L-lactate dehydrogenase complex protein LldF
MDRSPPERAKGGASSHSPHPGGIRQFRRRASAAIDDGRLQSALEGATGRFRDSRVDAFDALPDAGELRDHFKEIRSSTLAHLADHVARFEGNAQAAGAQVHRATDGAQACQIVNDIAQGHGVLLATKSKSMLTEEIHLNQALQEAGVTPVETDLGEFIIQLANEPPFHILAPAIHKTKDQVAGLFSQETGKLVEADDIPKLTAEARHLLREKFLAAGMGITGGNIGIAESGSVVLVTNEGNGEMVTALPPVHVVVIGIEKITPTWDDAAVWLALLARSATGQPLSIYTTVISGPARQEDADGPGELHIILVDNGRNELLGSIYEEALQCIRCGACLNVCPVYREAGGHAYGSPYSGPIGAVISPLLYGLEEYNGLPQASSLCGACLDVCPARIDLPRMLLALRADEVDRRILPWYEHLAEIGAATIFEHERLMRLTTAVLRLLQRPFIRNGQLRLPARLNPTPGRQLPHLAKTPFRDLWKEMETGDVAERPLRDQGSGTGRNPRIDDADPRPRVPLSQVEPSSPARGPWKSRRRYTDLASQFEKALISAGGEVRVAANLDEALDLVGEVLLEIEARKGIANHQPPFQSLDLHSRWPGVSWRVAGQGDIVGFRAFSAEADIGLSIADCALAETGSVAVSSGIGLSRFTALLPPVHLVLVPTSCLTVDIFTWAVSPPSPLPAAITLISGPSKTADIEQTLTTGVHGPKRFIAILYDDG